MKQLCLLIAICSFNVTHAQFPDTCNIYIGNYSETNDSQLQWVIEEISSNLFKLRILDNSFNPEYYFLDFNKCQNVREGELECTVDNVRKLEFKKIETIQCENQINQICGSSSSKYVEAHFIVNGNEIYLFTISCN